MTTTITQSASQFEIIASRQFSKWLFEQKISIVFTTYQTNKVFLLGINQQGRLSIFERSFERSTALHAIGHQTLYLSTSYQLWRFENALPEGKASGGYDCFMVPQVAWTTGALDIHDINTLSDGSCVFANTRFSCIAKVSEKYSFIPIWKPFFITDLTPEDRCHLSGFTCRNGELAFATAFASSNIFEGWRNAILDGGVLIDIPSNTLVTEGLSLPNNPVFYNEKLYLLNSGTGEFGTIDLKNGKFTPIVFCEGFPRGLTINNNFAIIGVSKTHEVKGQPTTVLETRLINSKIESKSGLIVVDLTSGQIVHNFSIQGFIHDIFDVTHLEGVFCPSAVGVVSDEIKHVITIGNSTHSK